MVQESISILETCSKRFSNPTLSTAASTLIASTRETFQSVMNLRGGRGRTNGKDSNNNNNNNKKVTPGEQELEALIEVAEYEVHQDPYRGLLSHQQSMETGTKITTPWNACEWGTLKPERTLKEDLCPQVIVRHVGHCACPALKAWTRTRQFKLQTSKKGNKKSGKKRSRSESTSSEDGPSFAVGLRPSDPSYRCSCDYNPLCLGSLGGVMNEVLTERCRDMEIPPPTLKETPEQGSPSKLAKKEGEKDVFDAIQSASASKEAKKKEVINLEVEEKETQKENNAEEEEEETQAEKASVDIFAFLGDSTDNNNADDDDDENVVKSKALQTNWQVPKGDPAHVYTTEDQNQDLSHIQYSPSTTSELKRLRRSLDADASKIRSYVYRTLRIHHGTRGDGLTVDNYMETLRQWHRSLLFVNPADEEHRVPSDRITLSIPPGIQNLGATCYLNTQLQCLAQNTAFLNGIFSWRIVNSNHSMNSVMTKLQLLLGQMVLGGDSKLSTLDFSNALGLEHDEQQDPNEFARLLFERMDESFQQCDNGGDLANLLQRIFHGLTTYETICMTCGNSSERSEGFMDLNLPIIKRPKETKTSTSAIKEAFAKGKGVDTDVQYCLDQYTCAELLEGDNQYFCSTCKCKQDAKRVMKLTELPPVLNVQLSRYVFDRTQYVKKKLTDKVLLPTTLYVEKSGGSKIKYLLCAVMRHQGTSAYRGHYVAETMNWMTGQWFEFNDETVKLLPEGPSCSYDPPAEQNSDSPSEQNSDKKDDDKSGDKEKKPPTLSGSQDAYNMYYVDENFLAKNAADALLRRGRFCVGNKSNDDGKTSRNDVLGDVAKQRETKYAILSEMCFADGRASDRLRRRKAGIQNFLFRDAGSLLHHSIDLVPNGDAESYVWVGAGFLRRFLCCERDIDQPLSSSGPVLRHKHLLCEHNRLHPRVARRGKLLPRPMFDAYASLLGGERALLLQESQTANVEKDINDCIITPSTNLFCSECSQSYRGDLSKKLDSLKNIKNLYDALDATSDDSPLFYDIGEDPTCPEEAYAYVISRQVATKYRKCVNTLMKTLAKFEEGATLGEDEISSESQAIFEGLDALDLSTFEFGQLSGNADKKKNVTTSDEEPDKPDKLFNSNVTCSHGKCNVVSNGRVVRFVSWQSWLMLKKVFPDAIEHKKKRVLKNGAKVVPNPDIDGCPECQAEKVSIDRLKIELENWAKETRENFELKGLLDGNRTVEREIEVHNFTTAENGCRLVHRTDIQTWRKALSTLAGASKIKSTDTMVLKAHVENIAFPSYHSVVLEFERQPVEKLVTSLRSLICREHRLVIKTAIFRDCADSGNEKNHSHQLSDCIAVLSDEEYRAYISSLAELLIILNSDTESRVMGSMGSPVVIDDDKPFLNNIREITNSYHPAIRMCVAEQQRSSDDILVFSLHGSTKEFLLSPGVCDCKTCMKEFAPLLHPANAGDDDKVESISIDSNDEKSESRRKSSKLGSAAADPILVESDIDDDRVSAPDTFDLRAFEVECKSSIDDALSSLQTLSALPSESDSNEVNFLRRSSRKRKSRYPSGSLLREDTVKVGLHHNMAALRLLLYEKCEVALSGHKLILVMSSKDGKPHKTLEINFEWGQRRLQELIDEMKDQSDLEGDTKFEPSKQLLMLYQKDDNGNARALHETVMDSLLTLANLEPPDSADQAGNSKKPKRNRPSERGFRGTLLQSSAAPAYNQNGNAMKKQMSSDVSAVSADAPAVSADVSAVSDEEKDNACSIKETAEKKRVVLSDSSSDDEVLKNPFSPKKSLGGQFEDAAIANGSKVVVESDSSEDEDQNGSAQMPISKISQDVTPERYLDQDQEMTEICSHSDQLRKHVLDALLTVVEQPADESNCWDSVNWAVESNPTEKSVAALLDIALAKYIDNQGYDN